MRERNEAIFRRWIHEVWKDGNEATIDELFDKNAVATFPIGLEDKPLYGVDEYKHFVRLVRRSFLRIEVTIDQIASDDHKVVSHCTVHAERFNGDESATPVMPISASGLCQMIFEDGRIIQTWCNIDVGRLHDSVETE